MDGPAYLFHDPVAAEAALARLETIGADPRHVIRGPGRVLFSEDRTREEVRAGLRGILLGVAAFVALTGASIVVLGGPGALGAGTAALVLVHGALIGVGVGGVYGMAASHLAHPEDDVTLHGDDVLIVADDDPRGRVHPTLERHGGVLVSPGAGTRPAPSTRT